MLITKSSQWSRTVLHLALQSGLRNFCAHHHCQTLCDEWLRGNNRVPGQGPIGVLKSREAPGVLGYEMHSNGAGRGDLNLGYDGDDVPLSSITRVTTGEYKPIAMNGKEVYKFATTCVPRVLNEALDNAGVTADDVVISKKT